MYVSYNAIKTYMSLVMSQHVLYRHLVTARILPRIRPWLLLPHRFKFIINQITLLFVTAVWYTALLSNLTFWCSLCFSKRINSQEAWNRSLKVAVQGLDFMAHPLHIHTCRKLQKFLCSTFFGQDLIWIRFQICKYNRKLLFLGWCSNWNLQLEKFNCRILRSSGFPEIHFWNSLFSHWEMSS
jgi:hypothetical protein